LQAVERPAAEGQAQVLGGGQGRGDDLGPLLGGIGRRTAGAGTLLEAGDPLLVEAADPGIGRGPRATDRRGDCRRGPTVGCRLDDAGAFDQTDRSSA
jgi:hypothetical protein